MRIRKLLAALLCLLLCLPAMPALAAGKMPYAIDVDIANQIVTVYSTADGSIVRQMLCSSGMNGCTPLGTYQLTERGRASERTEWTYLAQYRCYVKYATRIHLGYMFHSLPFDAKDMNSMQAQAASEFGLPTSHGCIRLRVEDAKFIAENCAMGTQVSIFDTAERNEDLRELLLVSSYDASTGMSYSEFLGISENDLGAGSAGPEVLDLQYRLSDLGYYGGEFDGKYSTGVVMAVKSLQKDLGLAQNGISSQELLEVVYSDGAPVSAGEIELHEGKSGPVVKKLQEALLALGIYGGAIDSIYDVDVTVAVQQFQQLCGYTADGVASPEVQRALYYLLDQIVQKVGETFSVETVTEEITMATVDASVNVNVRSYPDTESEIVGKMRPGDVVTVLSASDGWANIAVGTSQGYMQTAFLKPFTEENHVLRYVSADGQSSYTLGKTLAQRQAGEVELAQELSAILASAEYSGATEESVTIATVNTGSDDVGLNLRAEASGEAEVLVVVPNGTQLRVLEQGADFSKVGYDEQIGYLMNAYLDFREGSASEVVAEVEAEEAEQILAVVVLNGSEKFARVYEGADEDAKVLGRAEADTEVEVLLVNEETGWVLVSCDGLQGYMKDVNLSFRLM